MLRQPKHWVVLEIDQSDYLEDEDYTGIDMDLLLDRESLARILDKGMYEIKIRLRHEPPGGIE
jgi:hypothetical protein